MEPSQVASSATFSLPDAAANGFCGFPSSERWEGGETPLQQKTKTKKRNVAFKLPVSAVSIIATLFQMVWNLSAKAKLTVCAQRPRSCLSYSEEPKRDEQEAFPAPAGQRGRSLTSSDR